MLTSAHAVLLAAVLKRLASVTSASWSQHFLNIKWNKRYQHIKLLRQGTPCLWLISRVKSALNSQLVVKWAIMSATRAAHQRIVKNIDTFIHKVLLRVLKEASHNHQKRKYDHGARVAVIIHKWDIWNHLLLKGIMLYYERLYCVKIKHIIPSLFGCLIIRAPMNITPNVAYKPLCLPPQHMKRNQNPCQPLMRPLQKKKYIKVQFMNSSSRQVCSSTGWI